MPSKVAMLVIAVAALLSGSASATRDQSTSSFRVLAFTKTAGFRHASIPSAVQALRELGARNSFAVDATEDPGAFTDANLRRYAVVAFVLTTGDVLDDARQAAFERYIRAGHGFVGVHSATDTEYGWSWYGRLVGAFFRSHPAIQTATVDVADPRHPSTTGLPRRWVRQDEWYNFAKRPAETVRVLARLDEATYSPGDGAMGRDHPISWAHEYDGGRAWYTGGGHTESSYREPLFRAHLLGGIQYAAGLAAPSVLSVSTAVRARRVTVVLRIADCRSCAARIEVRLRGRRVTVPMRLSGGRASARTPALPAGRWTLVVTVKNRESGRQTVVRRPLRIRRG
jgi:cytochrome c